MTSNRSFHRQPKEQGTLATDPFAFPAKLPLAPGCLSHLLEPNTGEPSLPAQGNHQTRKSWSRRAKHSRFLRCCACYKASATLGTRDTGAGSSFQPLHKHQPC